MKSDWRFWLAIALWLTTWAWLWLDVPFLPLWPSLLALSVVFLLRRVVTGILAGAAAGVIVIERGDPIAAFPAFFTDHLVSSLQSSWNISVLIFTLLLGGFVALIEHGGGMRTLLKRFLRQGGDPAVRLQSSALGMGLVCFFDGLANSMLVGRTLSPLAARAGVSREKLAYLVDSTSAAVACVAFVSTWIAYQLSMIREGFAQVNLEINPYSLFLHSIPYNLYCWLTLVLVAVVIFRGWDIGPMDKAEVRARRAAENAAENLAFRVPKREAPASVLRAVVPLGVLVGGILTGLYLSGRDPEVPFSWTGLADAFGEADAATVLVAASALACLAAFLCSLGRREIGEKGAADAFLAGMTRLFVPALILVSAWTLGSTLRDLETAAYLTAALQDRLPLFLLPSAVFLTGMAIAFTTGTSWGTMGVLMPLALPVVLTLTVGTEAAVAYPLVAAVVAAVFGGAVFGDHCSPLSDTTIVSSIACGLEPMEHVRTQIPYAFLAAGVSLMAGYLPIGLGVSVWIALPGAVLAVLLLPVCVRGKRSR